MRKMVGISTLLLTLVGLACGSSEPASSAETDSPATVAGGESTAAETAPESDHRWPERTAEHRFHLILHPIDINAENVEADAVEGIDQFFIDHVHSEAPEVLVAPPGSSVPEGLLGYVLEPVIDVIEESPDRCHVEVQLILMTHEEDLRADIPTSASAIVGEGHHRQRAAVQGAFGAGLTLLREALEAAARRDAT